MVEKRSDELGTSVRARASVARAALRKAGGEWPEARQHQAKAKADPDPGWISCVIKECWKHTPYMRGSLLFGVTFEGAVFSATRLVTQRAKELINIDRRV